MLEPVSSVVMMKMIFGIIKIALIGSIITNSLKTACMFMEMKEKKDVY